MDQQKTQDNSWCFGLIWFSLIFRRIVGWIHWSWWIIMSPAIILFGVIIPMYIIAIIILVKEVNKKVLQDRARLKK